jgi:hypothetical protein
VVSEKQKTPHGKHAVLPSKKKMHAILQDRHDEEPSYKEHE